jgi:hypothetical protein
MELSYFFELDNLLKKYRKVLVRLLDETEVEKQWQITERDEAICGMLPSVRSICFLNYYEMHF